MAVNLKDVDPAIVSVDKGPKQAPPPPAPKKPDLPISSRIVAPVGTTGEGETAEPFYEVDWTTHCLVSTIDSKVVAIPRSVAAKVPVVAPILADQAADDHTHIPIGTNATAAIAIAHWIEKVGSASAKTETVFPTQCLYTEMSSLLQTEWEKDFDARILNTDSETLLRVTNFAEQNGMTGLLDFCIISISCAVRGKSNHEMMVALCVDGEELTQEEVDAGKAAYPWVADITAVHADE